MNIQKLKEKISDKWFFESRTARTFLEWEDVMDKEMLMELIDMILEEEKNENK
jgi:hypothetical protein